MTPTFRHSGRTRAGRGVRLRSRFGSWFGIDIGVWSQCGITPLWWEINTNKPFSGITTAAKVQNLLEEAVDSYDDDGWVCIPIRLKTGVERDRVIDSIVEQIRSIGDRLNRAFPA